MIVAIASGKGGTGKTTVAVNLARMLAQSGRQVAFCDCDVEAPNAHIFLKPEIRESGTVSLGVPEPEEAKCTRCGACGEICQFSAIALIGDHVITFPELCHACGGCFMACEAGALEEVKRELGVLEKGQAHGIAFYSAKMRIGEAMSPPLIDLVKKSVDQAEISIIDAPPGTSCPVIRAVQGVDYVLLVTEPTPFGLNDLGLAVETMRQMGLPFGLVINRAGTGDRKVYEYAKDQHIEILAEIPDTRQAAHAYSKGELLVDALPELRKPFLPLQRAIERRLDS